MKRIIIYVMFPAMFLLAFKPADSILSVLRNFEETYRDADIKMDYKIFYLTHDEEEEIDEEGQIQITQDSYYKKSSGIIEFFDGQYSLVIDDRKQNIEVQNLHLEERKMEQPFLMDSLAQCLQSEQQAELIITEQNYKITVPSHYYTCTYLFDKTNYYLKKLIYDFADDDDYLQMIVVFNNILINDHSTNYYESHEDFVSIIGHKISPNNNLSNYSIHLNQN